MCVVLYVDYIISQITIMLSELSPQAIPRTQEYQSNLQSLYIYNIDLGTFYMSPEDTIMCVFFLSGSCLEPQ